MPSTAATTTIRTNPVARDSADVQRAAVGQILIEFESRRAAQGAAVAALERVTQQRDQLVQRIAILETNTRDSAAPLQAYQGELDGQLARQVEVQADMSRQRDNLTAVEQRVKAAPRIRETGCQ